MTCGIYMIQNKVNNKIYIGQAGDIKERWGNHKSTLRRNRHKNRHLQSSWNKYGESNFEFTILLECEESDLNMYEEYYIFELMAYDPRVGYNKTYGGEGGRPTEETIEKQRESSKRTWEDPKYREIQDKAHNTWSKTYVQTTLDNRLIKIWKSSNDLITKLNLIPSNFWHTLSGSQQSTSNYRFYYLEEYIDKFGSIHTAINDNDYITAIELSKQQEKKNSLQRKLQYGFAKRLNKEIKPYINRAKEVHSYMSQFNSYIVCLTHNKIFDSIESANMFYNIEITRDAINSFKGQSFSGVYKGEPLVWSSFKDYVKMSKSEIDSLVLDAKQKMSHYYGSASKPIVCVEKDCAYISLGYVERLGIASRSGIRKCLQGIQRTVGGYHWEYYYGGNPRYDEMIKNQEKELKDRMRGGTQIDESQNGENNPSSSPIVQLTLDGELVKVYKSSHEAKNSGFHRTSVKRCCQGREKTHKGYKWMYLSDYEAMKKED